MGLGIYDRDGNEITTEQWSAMLAQKEPDMRRVAKAVLPDGRVVSTVWLGLDHRFGEGKPLIFETMVFGSEGDFASLDCERYETLSDAEYGHHGMVDKWLDAPPASVGASGRKRRLR